MGEEHLGIGCIRFPTNMYTQTHKKKKLAQMCACLPAYTHKHKHKHTHTHTHTHTQTNKTHTILISTHRQTNTPQKYLQISQNTDGF